MFTWPDGDRFQGSYLRDKMHGEGTYHFRDGTRSVCLCVWLPPHQPCSGVFLVIDGQCVWLWLQIRGRVG